jgi:hypothetical protein
LVYPQFTFGYNGRVYWPLKFKSHEIDDFTPGRAIDEHLIEPAVKRVAKSAVLNDAQTQTELLSLDVPETTADSRIDDVMTDEYLSPSTEIVHPPLQMVDGCTQAGVSFKEIQPNNTKTAVCIGLHTLALSNTL